VSPSFLQEFAEKRRAVQQECELVAQEIRTELESSGMSRAAFPFEPLLNQYTSEHAKRIRGVLFMAGYSLIKGDETDLDILRRPSALIELFHTYILGIDDIQDRALSRHGLSVTHVALAEKMQREGVSNASHYGTAFALDAILGVQHFATEQWTDLVSFPAERVRRASKMLHRCLFDTSLGQTLDLLNSLENNVRPDDILQVMMLKTSEYTVTKPTQVGMTLAEASGSELEIIVNWGEALGIVFQLGDDRQTYEPNENGKDKSSDIAEGKKTLIVLEMLKRAGKSDKDFMQRVLGSGEISKEDFERFVALAHTLGAYSVVKQQEQVAYEKAVESLNAFPEHWHRPTIEFLRQMAGYFLERKT